MKQDFYLPHEQEGDCLAKAGQLSQAAEAYKLALKLKPEARWIAQKIDRLAVSSIQKTALGNKTINLFLPYYTPRDHERAEELNYCFKSNLDSGLFARIVLMIDDDSAPPLEDRRVSVMRLDRRPSYLDWVRESRRRFAGQISILANSDIYFDDSVGYLIEIFNREPEAFVALSRYDKLGEDLIAHPNPHWSQDTWAFMPSENDSTLHDQRFDIPLGVPRCDNKIAYVFATQGYRVFNPLSQIRSIHVHETGLRYYSKKGDRRVIGGVAMVHPGKALMDPAKLDLEIWSERSDQTTGIKLNRSLENWAREAARAAEPRRTWFAYDQDWQYPAITERHAFVRMRALLNDSLRVTSSVYLGFPFATLVDLHTHVGPDNPRTRALQAELDKLVPELKTYERVFTVGQHIRAKKSADLFAKAGVTDLFWSHCVTGESSFPGYPNMRIHPFPLYPVQQAVRGEEDFDRARPLLFSFIGARAQEYYLTDARNHILDLLSDDPRGLVRGRDAWHYEKVVYDAQILRKVSGQNSGLVNDSHADDFRKVMDDTTFALCPSGSGPSSIRLWEAILNGAIPVILADTWKAPGDPALWEAATLRCAETRDAIAALPDQLEAIAANPDRLKGMRRVLSKLASRYGPDGFVDDVFAAFEGPHIQ